MRPCFFPHDRRDHFFQQLPGPRIENFLSSNPDPEPGRQERNDDAATIARKI